MLPLLLPSLLACCALAVSAEPTLSTAVLHHRLLPFASVAKPGSSDPPFEPRYEVSLSAASPSLPPTVADVKDLSTLQKVDPARDEWYQIALEVDGVDRDLWPLTVVRACHLLLPASQRQDVLTLHYSDDLAQPFHFSYAIYNIPRDGSCPPDLSLSIREGPRSATDGFDTVVRVRVPDQTPQAILAAPPVLDADTGRPVEPVQEKGFLQKYWYYLAIPLVLMAVLPEPEAAPAAK